jgi:hypothetical protein
VRRDDIRACAFASFRDCHPDVWTSRRPCVHNAFSVNAKSRETQCWRGFHDFHPICANVRAHVRAHEFREARTQSFYDRFLAPTDAETATER